MSTLKRTLLTTGMAMAIGFASASGGIAAGKHGGGHHGDMKTGQRGDASQVTRTIEITMKDNFYEPEEIEIKAGETVRFVVKNHGEFLHEFNIGTAETHVKHQEEMAMMMEHGMITATKIDHEKMKMDHGGGHGMNHDDANSVLVEPGKTGELIWKFSEAKNLEFACNLPGHYDSGMMGPVRVGQTH